MTKGNTGVYTEGVRWKKNNNLQKVNWYMILPTTLQTRNKNFTKNHTKRVENEAGI